MASPSPLAHVPSDSSSSLLDFWAVVLGKRSKKERRWCESSLSSPDSTQLRSSPPPRHSSPPLFWWSPPGVRSQSRLRGRCCFSRRVMALWNLVPSPTPTPRLWSLGRLGMMAGWRSGPDVLGAAGASLPTRLRRHAGRTRATWSAVVSTVSPETTSQRTVAAPLGAFVAKALGIRPLIARDLDPQHVRGCRRHGETLGVPPPLRPAFLVQDLSLSRLLNVGDSSWWVKVRLGA